MARPSQACPRRLRNANPRRIAKIILATFPTARLQKPEVRLSCVEPHVTMRLIGHLPNETNARTFSSHLLRQNISHEVEAEGGQWAFWIHSEDQWRPALGMLAKFREQPHPELDVYDAPSGPNPFPAEAEETPEAELANHKALLLATVPYGAGAVTLVLIGVSLAVTFLVWAGFEEDVLRDLLITSVSFDSLNARPGGMLPEITHGEFWRLLTPTLVNFDVLPLLFNTLLLLHLGSMIEGRLSAGRLGLLFIVIGVASNLAQFYLCGPGFCGVAGVLFGLLGFIWMRGRFDPDSGLYLRSQTVALMLVFYVIGLAGTYSAVFKLSLGTVAQTVGLIMGLAWGYLSSLPAQRGKA